MLEFRYDTQLLIDGDDLDEDEVFDYIVEHFKGDSLLAVGGDGDPIKIHFHTNEPWLILEYGASLGKPGRTSKNKARLYALRNDLVSK